MSPTPLVGRSPGRRLRPAGRAGGLRAPALPRLAAGSTPRRNLQGEPPAASAGLVSPRVAPLTLQVGGPRACPRRQRISEPVLTARRWSPAQRPEGCAACAATWGGRPPRGGVSCESPPVRPGPAAAVACASPLAFARPQPRPAWLPQRQRRRRLPPLVAELLPQETEEGASHGGEPG